MGLIAQLADTIDNSMVDYIQTVFNAVTDPIRSLLKAVGIVGLLYMGLNQILQFRTIQLSTYLFWILRYLLIFAFATIWANFKGVYDVFIALPQDYSALLTQAIAAKMAIATNSTDIIDPSVIVDTYTGMDEFGHAIVTIAYKFLNDLSIFNIGKSLQNIFLGALILIIGGFFLAACAITLIIAKVGFAVAVSLAPLAIVMLMLEQTREHFNSWLKLAVSFLVLPLLTSALMSIILFLAGQVLKDIDATNVFQIKYLGFLLVMLSALFLLFQLPTMASTLAAASVATGGASTLMAGVTKAKSAGRQALSGAKMAYRGGQRVRDGMDVASKARAEGASKTGAAWAAFNGMRQSSQARATRRDQRLEKRMAGGLGGIGNRNGTANLVGERTSSSSDANDDGGGGNSASGAAQPDTPSENAGGAAATLASNARQEKRKSQVSPQESSVGGAAAKSETPSGNADSGATTLANSARQQERKSQVPPQDSKPKVTTKESWFQNQDTE